MTIKLHPAVGASRAIQLHCDQYIVARDFIALGRRHGALPRCRVLLVPAQSSIRHHVDSALPSIDK